MVESILISNPETRDSDYVLYVEMVRKTNKQALDMPFMDVMLHRRDYGLPFYESVSRARRKVQANNEHLRASKKVDDARFENYKEIKEWSAE